MIGTNVEKQPVKNHAFNIYPNPSTDLLFVEGDENFTVSIIDLQGKILTQVNNNHGVSRLSIDLTSFNSGVYIVKISNKTMTELHKIIINN